MIYRRATVLAVVAGVSVACSLTLGNLLAGPQVCGSALVCLPPLPGQTGCGPVSTTCSGTIVPAQVVTALSIGAALLTGIVLGSLRSRKARRAPGA